HFSTRPRIHTGGLSSPPLIHKVLFCSHPLSLICGQRPRRQFVSVIINGSRILVSFPVQFRAKHAAPACVIVTSQYAVVNCIKANGLIDAERIGPVSRESNQTKIEAACV